MLQVRTSFQRVEGGHPRSAHYTTCVLSTSQGTMELFSCPTPTPPLSPCMAGSAFRKSSSLVEQPSPKRNGLLLCSSSSVPASPPPARSCVLAAAFSEALEFVSVLLVMHTALGY